MKRTVLFLFLLVFSSFCQAAPTIEPTPAIPLGIIKSLPADAEVLKWEEGDFCGPGSKNTLVIYRSKPNLNSDEPTIHFSIFSNLADHYTALFEKDFEYRGGIYENSGSYFFRPTDHLPFLIIGPYTGASIGGAIFIYQWRGHEFKQIGFFPGWGFQIEDLKNDGQKEMVVTERYAPVDVYAYEKGYLVPSDYDFPMLYNSDIDEALEMFTDPDVEDSEKDGSALNRVLPECLYTGRIQDGLKMLSACEHLYSEAKNASYQKRYFQETKDEFMAQVLMLKGREKDAIDLLMESMKGLQGNAQAQAYYVMANTYFEHKDFKKALAALRTCVRLKGAENTNVQDFMNELIEISGSDQNP